MPHVSTMKLPNTIIELNSLVAPRSDVVLMSKLIGQCSGLLLPTHELHRWQSLKNRDCSQANGAVSDLSAPIAIHLDLQKHAGAGDDKFKQERNQRQHQ